MECLNCKIKFSTMKEYNKHVSQNTCTSKNNNSFYEDDYSQIVYTNAGEPIRLQDDISEYLNEDDDDYVGEL